MSEDEFEEFLQHIAEEDEQHLTVINPQTGEMQPVLAEPIGVALRCKTNVGEWQFSWNFSPEENVWVAMLHFECPNCKEIHTVRLDDDTAMRSNVKDENGNDCGPNASDFHDACDHLHSLGHHVIEDQARVIAKLLDL